MQRDKFSRAEFCINENTKQSSSSTAVTISSPKHVSYGSATYWKLTYESAMKAYHIISEKYISLEEIHNLLPATKVTPKVNKENVELPRFMAQWRGKNIGKGFSDQGRQSQKGTAEIQATTAN